MSEQNGIDWDIVHPPKDTDSTGKRYTDVNFNMEEEWIQLKDNGKFMIFPIHYTDKEEYGLDTLEDLLNSQDAKIKELEQQNKILKRLYDLDNISDTFYTDAHRIKNKKANSPIANVFNYHDANVLCGLLNNLLPYKLLVREHKQDLESIYGKPIKEQLHDVLEHDV